MCDECISVCWLAEVKTQKVDIFLQMFTPLVVPSSFEALQKRMFYTSHWYSRIKNQEEERATKLISPFSVQLSEHLNKMARLLP